MCGRLGAGSGGAGGSPRTVEGTQGENRPQQSSTIDKKHLLTVVLTITSEHFLSHILSNRGHHFLTVTKCFVVGLFKNSKLFTQLQLTYNSSLTVTIFILI